MQRVCVPKPYQDYCQSDYRHHSSTTCWNGNICKGNFLHEGVLILMGKWNHSTNCLAIMYRMKPASNRWWHISLKHKHHNGKKKNWQRSSLNVESKSLISTKSSTAQAQTDEFIHYSIKLNGKVHLSIYLSRNSMLEMLSGKYLSLLISQNISQQTDRPFWVLYRNRVSQTSIKLSHRLMLTKSEWRLFYCIASCLH